jgi:hypothetical protein
MWKSPETTDWGEPKSPLRPSRLHRLLSQLAQDVALLSAGGVVLLLLAGVFR